MQPTPQIRTSSIAGLLAGLAFALAAPGLSFAAHTPPLSGTWQSIESIRWPEGTELLPCVNQEGVLLLTATMRGRTGADTTGRFVLDTGAGFLAIDYELARSFDLADSDTVVAAVGLASRPLPSFRLGGLSMDDVDPILTIDAKIVQRVTDLPILGLLGQLPLSERAVWIDYRAQKVALVPIPERTVAGEGDSGSLKSLDVPAEVERSHAALAMILSNNASAIPFRLVGDGKAIVAARVSNPKPPRYSNWINLIVDTGASKTVLFEPALAFTAPRANDWPSVRGLSAPTLIGDANAMLARVPSIELRTDAATLRAAGIDVAVIKSELSEMLGRVAGEPIGGLLGYSFLKRFRVAIDYPNRVLWLDPIPDYADDRPLEYSHIGLQLERREGVVTISGVAEGSPSARAHIVPGDVLVRIDGELAGPLDVVTLAHRMEGPPGSAIHVTVRRGPVERTLRLHRRRLL
jgi:PDZ domain